MTCDTKWYFTLDQEKKNWKVFQSDKPAMTGNKVLGSVTNVHGSKSYPSILKVRIGDFFEDEKKSYDKVLISSLVDKHC